MKSLLSILVVLFFVSCESNPAVEAEQASTPKDITAAKQVPATPAIEPSKQDCFQGLFEQLTADKRYTVKRTEHQALTKPGFVQCFLDKNQVELNVAEKEVLISIVDTATMEHPVLITELVFPDEQSSAVIFEKLDRGYYDNCIGVKEPNFLIQEKNHVYVFYVDAEYYRAVLKKFKASIMKDIAACKALKVGECS